MPRNICTSLALFSAVVATSAYGLALRHVEYSVTIAGLGTSKIRGSGLITPSANPKEAKADITLKVDGDAPNATRPWHIHHGTCKKSGAILGGAAAYPAIRTNAQGAASSKLVLKLVFPDTGDFYLSVHESAANMSKVIACGDLILED